MSLIRNLFVSIALLLMSTVTLAATSLSWEPPTTRVDGTALTSAEIGGYEVCVNATQVAGCANPIQYDNATLSVPVVDLVSDFKVYHYSVRVYDTNGLYSAWSEVVSAKLIGPPSAPRVQIR